MPTKKRQKKAHTTKALVTKIPDQLSTKSGITLPARNGKELPEGWKWVKLGDACTVIMGQSPPSSTYNTDRIGLPFFQGKAEFTDLHPVAEKWCNAPNKVAESNDVLLSVRAPVGTTNIADQKCCIGRGLAAIRFNNYKYAFYFLRSIEQQLDKKGTGTTFRAISGETLRETLFPLPSEKAQLAIVSKIEELLSELDKGKQQLETAQQQLKIYRQAVLKWAFEGKLTNKVVKEGELPEGWIQVPIKEIAEISPKLPNRDKISGKLEVQFMPMKLVEEVINKIHLTESRKYEDVLKGSYTPFVNGDVLFAKVTPCMENGKIAIANNLKNGIGFGSSEFHVVRPGTRIIGTYLFHYLVQDKFRNEAANEMTGAVGLRRVPKQFIENYRLPLPSLDEQELIIKEIESRLSVCDKVEETISNSLEQAETLRQSILKKAFEGKLLAHAEVEAISRLERSQSAIELLPIAAEPVLEYKKKGKQIHFPRLVEGISTTDLHAGVLAMVIEAHEKDSKYLMKLSHVKGEKIAHLVEAHIGVELGRVPVKDAAGPDDFPHLKKVESRATKAGWFSVKKLRVGQTYSSRRGMPKIIKKVEDVLSPEDLSEIQGLIKIFLPFDLQHAEVIATLYAGWNNLLLDGKKPTDEEIVYESRENWSDRKLTIKREDFFNTLLWMRNHNLIPVGRGRAVTKPEPNMKRRKNK